MGSTDEINKHLESDAVQEFFKSIDVDVSEAQCLFDLLDLSQDGFIDFEEFIGGCLRLQGNARALDLLLMTIDTRSGFEMTRNQIDELAREVSTIIDLMRNPNNNAACV